MLGYKRIYKCATDAVRDTINHDGIEHAGYIAFLAILSLFPFLVFFVAIVGFFGQSDLGIRVIHAIIENNFIPESILSGLKPRLDEIASGPPQGLLTIAILGAIWTASSMVDGMRTILNRAYRVNTPPAYIFRRLMSVAELLILTAVLIAVTFLLIIAPNLWENAKHLLHLEEVDAIINFTPIWHYLRYVIATFVLFLVVLAAYFTLPNIKQTWLSILPGATFVIFLWLVAGELFSLYLSNFEQVNLIYGSLGGIIAALLFFYIGAMIFIFGAEFNYRISRAAGQKIEVKEPK